MNEDVNPTQARNTADTYDVCLSFAGEDREYVDAVAAALRKADIRVFYDAYEETALWGKDLYQHLADVYQNRARYCVVFLSAAYAAKLWTRHELKNAQARAFKENREYLLPARFDDTEMPGVPSTVAYIDLRTRTPQQFADLLVRKIRSDEQPQQPGNSVTPSPTPAPDTSVSKASPPGTLGQAVMQWVWSLPRPLRVAVIIVGCIAVVSFAVWSTLPDAQKEAILRSLWGAPTDQARTTEATNTDEPTEATDTDGPTPTSTVPSTNTEDPKAKTPDYSSLQGYLGPAPAGVDAYYAWKVGGTGEGVTVALVGGVGPANHEDLGNQVHVWGDPSSDVGWRDFSVASSGVVGARRNGLGITGIAPHAKFLTSSIFGRSSSSSAIRHAADQLKYGDVLLIQLTRSGPKHEFSMRADHTGFIPIEWWPDDFAAIRYAIKRGIIVIEPAGDGAESLDDRLYTVPATGFPTHWSNPFQRGKHDSGSILVGAGAPPEGTHGNSFGPDRSRLDHSNYGSVVDVQGWGREVTTTGYGDLQGGENEHRWYTDKFAGSGAAAAMVAGAVACVQSALVSRDVPVLSPAEMRTLLRDNGSAQADAPNRPRTQRIGPRPDLRKLIQSALALRNAAVVGFQGRPSNSQTLAANLTR